MNSVRPLVLVLLASPMTAQGREWIVDQNNGPGTHFTDLAPAVAAAVDGDLIRVRPGLYMGGITTAKALTILGPGGAGAALMYGLTVSGLPAGRQAVIEGLFCLSRPGLTLANDQGRVLVDRIAGEGGWTITNCRQVQINGCQLGEIFAPLAPPVVTISASTVTLTDCQLQAAGSFGGGSRYYPTEPAISGGNSTITLSRCRLAGGDGATMPPGYPDSPGLAITNCITTISGEIAITAGQGGPVPVAAIVAPGGSLTIDPSVPLASSNGAPLVSGSAAIAYTWLPTLGATGAPPAGIARAVVRSPAGDVVLLFGSLSADPQSLGPLGDLWLDPLRFVLVGAGLQGTAGLTFTIPLANDRTLAFHAWTLQALDVSAAGGFKLTNAVGVALD